MPVLFLEVTATREEPGGEQRAAVGLLREEQVVYNYALDAFFHFLTHI